MRDDPGNDKEIVPRRSMLCDDGHFSPLILWVFADMEFTTVVRVISWISDTRYQIPDTRSLDLDLDLDHFFSFVWMPSGDDHHFLVLGPV
jgi:hypothetical protein